MKISNDPQSTLVTYSLGTCIGISVYDPIVKTGGLLHFMLPDSSLDEQKSKLKPFMFADTGIPKLFKTMYQYGAKKSRMKVFVVGGAQQNVEREMFNIGKRNILAVKKIFFKNNVITNYLHVGGTSNRTVRMNIFDGEVWIRDSIEGDINIK
nr:chemotaxis protein CheD [uncultured bacterium]